MTTCLVVDDEEDHRDIGKILCSAMDLDTYGAGDGLEALKFCKDKMPDLILLDWMMPKLDGIRFLRELRNLENGKKPYVLICSARGDEKSRDIAIEAGANDYLPKPFSPPDLMSKIIGTDIL